MYDLKQWMIEMEIEGIKRGMKPSAFCDKAGVNKGTWSNWKKKNNAKLATMLKIQKAIMGE
jgi:hypothetical protein